MSELDLNADIIDIRDIIERVGGLEDEDGDSLATLTAILDELKGRGGDEQWRGDWYPLMLIRDSHFTDYARELVEDIGDMPKGLPAYLVIDWDETAKKIRMDYSPIEINNTTYWYR